MALADRKNYFGLDPFQICFPKYQKYYGRGERDSPWPLLMRTIYNILYDEERKQKRKLGVFAIDTPNRLLPEKSITPRDWARAFNTMCVSLRLRANPPRIDRPEPIDETIDERLWKPVFRLLPAGKEKVINYFSDPDEKRRTAAIVRRVESHMKYIMSVLPPDYKEKLP